ncbi:T9SS type A sorting domain-containing protein [bacterium SCSIO 12643]|nr:T9SS type A sorting domain-containing protein [bacterium SCSIO 12643]
MRKKLRVSIFLIALATVFSGYLFTDMFDFVKKSALSEREQYEERLRNHKYKMRYTTEELSEIPKADRPDLAYLQDYLETMNPALGRPEPEKLIPIWEMTKNMQQSTARTPGASGSPWVERGPNNVGGRTRALAWDPTSTNKVWGGGVTGGLWYNNNITSSTSSWQAVNDFWDNITVTAIAFDPNNSNIIYVGTGESYTGASRGAGIWKSTNGGTTFSQISSTSSFYYINDLVVRNESNTSVVYAAVAGRYYQGQWHGTANEGLQRSVNGGTSWTQVLPNVSGAPEKPTDLDIASDNELWVGVDANSYGDGGGKVYASTSGTSFTLKHTHSNPGRVSLACAPSNSNYVYVAFEYNQQLDAFKRTTNDGSSWALRSEPNDADNGIPATDFTRGQAWYNLVLDVDPNNMNTVMIGGIDLFKTTNGGTSWQQISHWYGGFGYTDVHADQHAIVYKPGSSSIAIFGNDGGIYYSSNVNASSPSIPHRVKDYNVTQYYACAIHPTANSNYFLAGSQDNGTQQYASAGMNSTTEATGGDGAYCHIDQTNGDYQTTSYVYNDFYHSSDGGANFSNISTDQNTGKFINPSDLDDNQNILYTFRTPTSLYRVTGFQSSNPVVSSMTISSLLSDATNLKVSPYTTTSTTLFIGTEAGRLFKITNANSNPVSSDITGSSFPTGSISCIEFGQTENQIIVTFSNYGVTSVWYTANGGTTWTAKEGNLPDMPVRWALFNPSNIAEVILATEVGVWSTSNFNSSSPTWTASNSGLANVRVDMLQMRSSDKEVIAATHGRGLFSSNGFAGTTNPSYCAATSTTIPCDEYISNVTIGTINNTTTCGNYSDYTSQSTTVSAGSSVAMTISTLNAGGNAGYNDDQVAVWVDWNNDQDFTDPGEQEYIVTYSSSVTFPLSFNITVPSNATSGSVRMRVRMVYEPDDGQITPCGSSQWGEVEDYTLVVQGGTPAYCTATSTTTPCDEYISNVTIGNINNTTTCGNYSDFTSQTATVSAGASVPMSITTLNNGGNAGYNDDQVAVWVDWNNDLDFNDPGEQEYIVTYSASVTFPLSFNITVPSNVSPGSVRMRVRMVYEPDDGQITPCGSSQWGEVEDYTLNVVAASSINWTSQPNNTVIECDESANPSNTGTPTATSTCLVGVLNIASTDSIIGGSCANSSWIYRKWTASDACGNVETYIQVITIEDQTDPTITCPADQNVVSSNGVNAELPDYRNMATVSDNCSLPNNITITQSPVQGSTVVIGTTVVTLTATDECGNTADCSFNADIQIASSVENLTVDEMEIYPNPSSGVFYINLGLLQQHTTGLKVLDMLGKEVYRNDNYDGKMIQNIDLNGVESGVYYLEVKTETRSFVKRILKF